MHALPALLIAASAAANPPFTLDETLNHVARVAGKHAAAPGWSDPELARTLRSLAATLEVSLPIDPLAKRAGAPRAGAAQYGDSFMTDQGPSRPHLVTGTLASARSIHLASVGGSLLVVAGSAEIGFVKDSIVVVTGDVSIAHLSNSLVISGGLAEASHVATSTLLAHRLDLSNVAVMTGRPGTVTLHARLGMRAMFIGGDVRLLDTPHRAVRSLDEKATVKEATGLVRWREPVREAGLELSFSAIPACRTLVARNSRGQAIAVGMSGLPWRPLRGVLPDALSTRPVVAVYDGSGFLEDGSSLVSVKATTELPTTLETPELLELGGPLELHVVHFYQPHSQSEPTRIAVEPTTRPAVVVLSSHDRTRWEVDLAPGARLLGVVLFGYQESTLRFVGGTAPFVADVFDWGPCMGQRGFTWPEGAGSSLAAGVARVSKLLGRSKPLEVTSSQGGEPSSTGPVGAARYTVKTPTPTTTSPPQQ